MEGLVCIIGNAWIEPAVEEVHAEIHHDIHKGHQENQGLHQRIVPAGHRLHEQQAKPIQIKDLLGDHEPAQQKGKLQANNRQDRE